MQVRRAIPELGPLATRQVMDMREHLFGQKKPPDGRWHYRYAPSIITRSEAELFGVSTPRFALRIYLNGDKTGFVNARRLPLLCEFARPWSQRTAIPPYAVHGIHYAPQEGKYPRKLLRRSSCIADCVIPLEAVPAGFQVVHTNLGRIYGEGHDIAGVSYVKHMNLSGGQCSQAVCFMGTALLHDYVKGVHGVADVTALVRTESYDELSLQGLDLCEMADYFSHSQVGLSAIWQYPGNRGYANWNSMLQRALQVYIRSNMPVALPVDSLRMAGVGPEHLPVGHPTILESNRLPLYSKLQEEKRASRHVVLIVGCNVNGEFLLNDTSRMPLMKATTEQLLDVRDYQDNCRTVLAPPVFLPLTPGPVRVPFEDMVDMRKLREHLIKFPTICPPIEQLVYPGMLRIAESVQGRAEVLGLPGFPTSRDSGSFCLGTYGDAPSAQGLPMEAREAFTKEFTKSPIPSNRWCWIQYIPFSQRGTQGAKTLWFWDAELERPLVRSLNYADAKKFLLQVLELVDGSWQSVWLAPDAGERQRTDDNIQKPLVSALSSGSASPKKKPLAGSLISSFSVKRGLHGATMHWPGKSSKTNYKTVPCELYCFMQGDVSKYLSSKTFWLRLEELKRFFWVHLPTHGTNLGRLILPSKQYDIKGTVSRKWDFWDRFGVAKAESAAVRHMAVLADKPRAVRQAARRIHKPLARRGIKVVALATFLPEIAYEGDSRQEAAEALKFLLRLAGTLRRKPFEHPVGVVEVVTGSLINGMWPGKDDKGQRVFVANRPHDSESILRDVLGVLRDLVPEAQKSGVRISIEAEPGPLYIVRDWNTIENLARLIANDDVLKKVVGLNLDVAHWELGHVSIDDVLKSSLVLRSVTHAHLSDYGRGHFGDVTLLEIHDRSHFEAWLDVIARAAAEPGRTTPFSGYVSVELEAARFREQASHSVGVLSAMIAGAETPSREC